MKRTPLRRRKPLVSTGFQPKHKVWRPAPKQREDGDWVTPQMHQYILARDGRCMAPVLDKDLTTPCADTWGNRLVPGSYTALSALQLDHVPDENGTAMGDRAKSDEWHLICICPFHHLQGWATSKRGRSYERAYLSSLRRE